MCEEAPDIPGSGDVVAWFGHWPTFHDAEVVSITLKRRGESSVSIHAFNVTSEIEPTGCFKTASDATVLFFLDGLLNDGYEINNHLEGFNNQNVLSGLTVKKNPGGYELVLEGIFGVDGTIYSKQLRVALEPGVPPDSKM